MAGIAGKKVLIYQGDGQDPETFSKLAATQSDQFTINNEHVTVNTKDSGGWEEKFPGGQIKSARISVNGVFEETADQDQLLNLAAASDVDDSAANFIFALGGSRQLRGRFVVDSFSFTGETQGAATFSAELSSDGVVVLEAATV